MEAWQSPAAWMLSKQRSAPKKSGRSTDVCGLAAWKVALQLLKHCVNHFYV
jgi:hypothetical protein